MVKEFVIFATRAEFDTFVAKINTQQGYPRTGNRASDGVPQPTKAQTLRYTIPEEHPDDRDNRVLAIIDERVLAPDRVSLDIKTRDEARTEGFRKDGDRVEDPEAPVIILRGQGNTTITVGTPFTDPGFVATDNRDGDITANVVVEGLPVDTRTEGVRQVTYTVKDAAGNVARRIRTINVVSID